MNTYWSDIEFRYITIDDEKPIKERREEPPVKPLYLPGEPYVYSYTSKYEQIDYVCIPGMVSGTMLLVSLVIADAVLHLPITAVLLFGLLIFWWLLAILVMGSIELFRWVKYVKHNHERKAEWKQKCESLTLEWNRNTSLDFAKQVRRK